MSAVQETDVVVGTDPTVPSADADSAVPEERKPKRKSSFREASAYLEDDSPASPTLERRPSSSRISFKDEHGGDVEEVSLLRRAQPLASRLPAHALPGLTYRTPLNPPHRSRLPLCKSHCRGFIVSQRHFTDKLHYDRSDNNYRPSTGGCCVIS